MRDYKVVLAVTLGTRDLYFDNKPLSRISKEEVEEELQGLDIFKMSKYDSREYLSPRRAGEYIAKNIDRFQDRLSFPILEPVINRVLQKEKSITQIILIATDQKKEREEFKADDTLYFAEIIKKLLMIRNKKLPEGRKIFKEEPYIILIEDNVTKTDEMNKFWKMRFKKKPLSNYKSEDTLFYISTTAGIDGINTPFLINSILNFWGNCIQLYKDEKTDNVYLMNFVDDFILDIEKRKLDYSLERYDYAAASEILKGKRKYEDYELFLNIAKNRLYFNLEEAVNLCDELVMRNNDDFEFRNELNNFYEELCSINNNLLSKIKELYVNARIKYIQKQYVDFVIRIFRVEESLNRYAVENYLDIFTDKEKDFSRFTNDVSKNQDLVDYLDGCKVNGQALIWRNNPNNNVLKVILKFAIDVNSFNGGPWVKNQEDIDKIKAVYNLNSKISILSQLRNKSIAAHGFEGVSEDKIRSLLEENGTSIEEVFKELENIINMDFDDNSYRRLNDLVRRKIIN